ncbi:MAG: OmpH family outer membrane protein [Salinivirgaceae bacterium]|jgi:outer membrane protein|nr:OmpH family outer membrane protein [Salinivirgaceae bacterium]
MKKIIYSLLLVVTVVFAAQAQRFAYVDTKYVLDNIPEYESAQNQLNIITEEWQDEITSRYEEIEKLYKEYEIEKVLLSNELKRKREEEILDKEREVKELQKKYFGKDGELFKKRQELVKPIQDQVFNAVKEIGETGNYAVVFDVASGMGILYNDPKYDKSDEVLQKLGYRN